MLRIFLVLLCMFVYETVTAQNAPTNKEISIILKEVNKIRSRSCKCGRSRYRSTTKLAWSDQLYKSAIFHAKDMERNGYFDHVSPKHGDLAKRYARNNYKWKFMGENIADGQESLKRVLIDWLKSPAHCELLMSKHPTELAIARYRNKWVLHMGDPIQ